MTERRFDAGEFLMRQGEPGDCLMVIQDGSVEVSVTHGVDRHVLKRSGVGGVFGEMALLTRDPRTADVVALKPVRALALPVEDFHRLARRHPALAEVLSRLTAYRLGRETHDALSGKIFHGYTIRRRLGRGGMAVVYEADETATGRRVALKMMSHRLVFDRNARRQFQTEADLIESFDHPNIARMFGRFEAFHTFFIVMEYCDGSSLDRILAARGTLPVPVVRRIVGQLASALSYAHGRRIVHRDIKPSNVMVNRDGIARLMDFGLARAVPVGGVGAAARTAGTPPYMAPEQLAGEPIGTAADLYALAGTTWEMLTGKSPFRGKSFDALRKEHAAWEIPADGVAAPGIGADLEAFLAGCLVRDPASRKADLESMESWAAPVRYEDLVEPGP
jgi:serine/threonine protein kinase